MLPLSDSFNFFLTCKTIHALTKLSRNCSFLCKKHKFSTNIYIYKFFLYYFNIILNKKYLGSLIAKLFGIILRDSKSNVDLFFFKNLIKSLFDIKLNFNRERLHSHTHAGESCEELIFLQPWHPAHKSYRNS